jgi:DNA-binding GntR family transcriptional regulator
VRGKASVDSRLPNRKTVIQLFTMNLPSLSLGSATAVHAVAEQLRFGLYSGQRKPGEVLKDTDLVEMYGVARPTARAAV